MVRVSAIIVAAGKGQRFAHEKRQVCKQFLMLADKPMIMHTISAFERCAHIGEIILVVPSEWLKYCQGLIKTYKCGKVQQIVGGGRHRQDSVYQGLKKISPQAQIVLIHDGVRPLVKEKIITSAIQAARKYKAAVPAVPVRDTIKLGRHTVEKTLQRSKLWSIQTPQAFQRNLILSAYKKARKDSFFGTDDAQLVERMRERVRIIEGAEENIKITCAGDLVFAQAMLIIGAHKK